jgi:hypothetical protein
VRSAQSAPSYEGSEAPSEPERRDEESAAVVGHSLIEPAGAPDLAPQRERPLELDADVRPRLCAPVRVQHHAQDAVDAEPGVPEASVCVVHLTMRSDLDRGD